ncbi:hypothetical protein GWI33_002419 [Rhynchophorus ferrugineus]|uniref:Ubiquitin-like protease family profile domain-containing protein n=1 Tax=Rhynchophorus ferrugineus TaxID=354439 RepID=A0A834ITP2_RHYFE|nr:hypothetical protein GWI33_002419 [Rhynchophorus ferrugineus]
MAQFLEVLNHGDTNVEQTGQFFSGSQDNDSTQIRYILADDTQQFSTQQLVHLSADQVVVVDRSQQPLQGVVIDQNQIAYQSSNQPQFNAVVQNTNVHMNSQPIYYMETSNTATEGVQTVQAVIDQTSTIQSNHQSLTQSVNDQISTAIQSRALPLFQVRTGIRTIQNPVNVTTRPLSNSVRANVPQARSQQSGSQIRTMTPPQTQLRVRVPGPQARQHGQAQQIKSAMANRQNAQLVKQVALSESPDPHEITNDLQNATRQLIVKSDEQNEMEEHMDTSNPITPYRKPMDTRPPLLKNPILSRLPSNIRITQTNNQPSQVTAVQLPDTILTQALQQTSTGQTNENTLMNDSMKRRPLSSNLRVAQINSQQKPSVSHVIDPINQGYHQAPTGQTNQNSLTSDNMKRRPLSRPAKVPNVPAKSRMQRISNPTNYNSPRMPNQQQNPRFPINQQPRYPNQQQVMLAQKVTQQQSVQSSTTQSTQNIQQQPQASQLQQNGESLNYVITPPAPNRPRQQRALPSYIPSSQIQQIIETTKIPEEFSDSIRMLVLLENGEQRLITFTLPREACTIQEVLEQVSVPFTSETNIQVTEANTNGINYIVTVGNVANFRHGDDDQDLSETDTFQTQQNNQPYQGNNQTNEIIGSNQSNILPENSKTSTPEPPKEVPKLIPGKLAVCSYCGYTGEDFNKCTRCSRKLPENVRSIDAPVKTNILKSDSTKELSSQGTSVTKTSAQQSLAKSSASPKKKNIKVKHIEESVVISSDEEEDDKKSVNKSVNEQLLKSLGASVTISPVTKEPSLSDVKKHVRKVIGESIKNIKISLKCRTVRIGSYRFYPPEDVVIDSKSVIIKAPVVDNKTDIKTVRIDKGDIVKVLVCFHKSLPVVFYYLNVSAAPLICDMLNLSKESGLFYDPIEEKEDSYRKITLLPEDLNDDQKFAFQQIYTTPTSNIMDELSSKEANDILIKTCPKDGPSVGGSFMSFSEIKQILLYPKEGQGRLSINTEDYVCLAVDQFLNDKIIDFYLKYLWENLPPEKQEKVHIFSTFFYKRLTTKPTKAARKSHPFEVDPTLTASEKRHCRVKNWTKKINLFEKDYIIVPINENAHWFLAIICFPGMIGAQTFDGKLYNPEPKPTKEKKTKKEKPIPCDELMLSDKDEAESEDSDLESDDSEESSAGLAAGGSSTFNLNTSVPAPTPILQTKSKKEVRPPIKQPCILIFDSLAGPSRCRVVATLRDYLTGASVKVPQQTNFTDCGLYLLQYVEQFFNDPIKDYNIPIKGIDSWFDEITVTKKREDICNLLRMLMEDAGTDTKILPDIALPTLDGKLIEKQEVENETEQDNSEDNPEDMFTDIDESEMINASMNSVTSTENGDANSENGQGYASEDNFKDTITSSQEKPSTEGVSAKSEITSTVIPKLKPSLSEFPRQSNKETLNYLKAKRIVRHKSSAETPEPKKTKMDV